MEGNEKVRKKNGISKNVVLNLLDFPENITVLDLSNRDLSGFSDGIQIPLNVISLNLSNNKFNRIPHQVLVLDKLEKLNISFNSIQYFDDAPSFLHTIQCLNLSNNNLKRPPIWVWTDKPKNLINLNLGNNGHISYSLLDGLIEDWLEHQVLAKEIDLYNCKLKNMKLLATVKDAKIINLGQEDPEYVNYSIVNHIEHIPCEGLDKCCDIERLNVCNTHIYMVNSNIDMYKHLIEINLAQNNIIGLPNEFCNLENLEICILSMNSLLYLPDNLDRLKKLVTLHLDSNSLCTLPVCLGSMKSLKTLDVYDNNLYEVSSWETLEAFDCGQNYFEELNSKDYLIKKQKIRQKYPNRLDGRKKEVIRDDSEYSKNSEDYDSYMTRSDENLNFDAKSSSSEDWDSDDYWMPTFLKPMTPPRSPWILFVKKKMEEGNFCPMDAHLVSVAEKVKYERLCNPKIEYESDGQFDDYSSDDS